jgi:hypothetical protein
MQPDHELSALDEAIGRAQIPQRFCAPVPRARASLSVAREDDRHQRGMVMERDPELESMQRALGDSGPPRPKRHPRAIHCMGLAVDVITGTPLAPPQFDVTACTEIAKWDMRFKSPTHHVRFFFCDRCCTDRRNRMARDEKYSITEMKDGIPNPPNGSWP